MRNNPSDLDPSVESDGNPDEPLKVGAFACFRRVDADQHDPDGDFWYTGMVTVVAKASHRHVPEDAKIDKGGRCPNCDAQIVSPSYTVLCEDGIERQFAHFERYFPNAEWDDSVGGWVEGSVPWETH